MTATINPATDACAAVPVLRRNGGAAKRFDVSLDCEGRARHPMADGALVVGRTVVNSWSAEFLVAAVCAHLDDLGAPLTAVA